MSKTATPTHEPPHMRDPTELELKVGAAGIPDDVSFYVWRDGAVQQTGNGNWEQDYEEWCLELFGPDFGDNGVPKRLHNLGNPNMWGYPPGPQCVQDMPPLPPVVTQAQIEALNKCADFESVIIIGDKLLQKRKEIWAAVKDKIPPPARPKPATT